MGGDIISSVAKLGFAESFTVHTTIFGQADPVHYVPDYQGQVHIFSRGIAGESVSRKLPAFQADLVISGLGSQRSTVAEEFFGSLFTFRGSSSPEILTFAEQPEVQIAISGNAAERFVPDYQGEARIGTFSGAAESITVNPVERELLFTVRGGYSSVKSTKSEVKDVNASLFSETVVPLITKSYFGSGTLHLSGESVARFTANEVGTGFISTLSGAAESVTINPSEDTALFEFSGIASIRSAVSEVKFVKTSIFNEPVRVYVIKDYVARGGTLDLSGDGLIKISLLHIGSGSVSTFSGLQNLRPLFLAIYTHYSMFVVSLPHARSVFMDTMVTTQIQELLVHYLQLVVQQNPELLSLLQKVSLISVVLLRKHLRFHLQDVEISLVLYRRKKEEHLHIIQKADSLFLAKSKMHTSEITQVLVLYSHSILQKNLYQDLFQQHLQYSKLLAMQLSELLQESLVEEIYTPLEMLENPEQFLLPQESLENSSVLREEKLPEQNLVLVPQQFLDLVQSPLSRHLIQVPPTHLYLVKQSTELQLLKQDLPPRRSEVRQRSSQLKHSQPQFQSRFLAMLSSISLLRTQVLVLSSYSARAKKLDHLAHMYPKEASSS